MHDFKGKFDVKTIGVSTKRIYEDDYEFTLGGKTYYADPRFNREKDFLTIVALDELKEAYKKIAALEAQIGRLTMQEIYKEL